jgi:hypothetical protein
MGRVIRDNRPESDHQHARVVFRISETAFRFEPAARIRSGTIRPLADAMDEYVPHVFWSHTSRRQRISTAVCSAQRLASRACSWRVAIG